MTRTPFPDTIMGVSDEEMRDQDQNIRTVEDGLALSFWEPPPEENNFLLGVQDKIANIMAKLPELPASTRPMSYIFRVHHGLRAVNKKAYEPVFLSIGPYHYDKRESDLQCMEQHKRRYQNDLLGRKGEQGDAARSDQIREYLGVLEELEPKARDYYADPVALEKNVFLEMLLLDGCFIIELFRKALSEHERETDPLFKADWVPVSVARDLMLLENQIPFFVLEQLYYKFGGSTEDLIFMARKYLPIYHELPSDVARPSTEALSESTGQDPQEPSHFKHLLDLVRKFMLVEEMRNNQGQEELTERATEQEELTERYSASELSDLGVKFKGVKKSKFYDITFENGTLEIPVIRISDGTEVRFRNLIAYEEHFCSEEQDHSVTDEIKYMGDYVDFMDRLVNESTDVALLRRHKIIESLMGDDGAIATMFNNLGTGRVNSQKNYYAGILHRLGEHCKKRRHKWMAKLRKNYLDSPWQILSVIAAAVLLILTIAQTVYNVLSFYSAK